MVVCETLDNFFLVIHYMVCHWFATLAPLFVLVHTRSAGVMWSDVQHGVPTML